MGLFHRKIKKILTFGLASAWLAAHLGCVGAGQEQGRGILPVPENFIGGPLGAAPEGDPKDQDPSGSSNKDPTPEGGTGDAYSFGVGINYANPPVGEVVPGPNFDPWGNFVPYWIEACAKVLQEYPVGKSRILLQGVVKCLKDNPNTIIVESVPCSEDWVMQATYNVAPSKNSSEIEYQTTDIPLETEGKFKVTLLVSNRPDWSFRWKPIIAGVNGDKVSEKIFVLNNTSAELVASKPAESNSGGTGGNTSTGEIANPSSPDGDIEHGLGFSDCPLAMQFPYQLGDVPKAPINIP